MKTIRPLLIALAYITATAPLPSEAATCPPSEYLNYEDDWYGCDDSQPFHGTSWPSDEDWSFGLQIGAFYPFSRTTRETYSDLWATADIEVAKRFCESWQLWSSIGYTGSQGRVVITQQDTDVHLIPLRLGFRYLFPIIGCLDAYLGANASYNSLRIHDQTSPRTRLSTGNFGAAVSTGITCHWCDCGYIGGFLDLIYQDFTFKRVDRNDPILGGQRNQHLSGLRLGIRAGLEY